MVRNGIQYWLLLSYFGVDADCYLPTDTTCCSCCEKDKNRNEFTNQA